MKILSGLPILFLLLVSQARGQGSNLDCVKRQTESQAFRQAPAPVKRVSKQKLNVSWKAGQLQFTDSGFVEGEIGGTSYQYCGYDAAAGFHLIGHEEGDLYTGVLVEHATGRKIPGGQQVIFSPDRKHYFTADQPNGLDAQEWYVRSSGGKVEWKGLSAITARNSEYEYVVAELSMPRWSSTGALQATLHCSDGKERPPVTVTLTLKDRKWVWLPSVNCSK